MTITFPQRKQTPVEGKVFLVNVDEMLIPESIKHDAINISHDVHPLWGEGIRYLMAKELLKTYEEQARLVITTKLHAALPCLAMGIPVIFFGNPDDYRVSLIKNLGLPIYPLPKLPVRNIVQRFLYSNTMMYRKLDYRKQLSLCNEISSKVDWYPDPLNIEKEKTEVIGNLRRSIENALKRNQ